MGVVGGGLSGVVNGMLLPPSSNFSIPYCKSIALHSQCSLSSTRFTPDPSPRPTAWVTLLSSNRPRWSCGA